MSGFLRAVASVGLIFFAVGMLNQLPWAGVAILGAIIASALFFVIASCRLSGIADDTAEQVARQLAETGRVAPPVDDFPVHDGNL